MSETPKIPDWKNARSMDQPHFAFWMSSLTSEGLHAKADIARLLAMLTQALSAAEQRAGELESQFIAGQLADEDADIPPDFNANGRLAWLAGHHKTKREQAEQRARDAERALLGIWRVRSRKEVLRHRVRSDDVWRVARSWLTIVRHPSAGEAVRQARIPFFDIHERGCTCSYCGNNYDKGLHYGLNIPPDWRAHNSWYVLKFGPRHYCRATHGIRWLK